MPIPLTLSRLQLCNWGFQCGVLQTVSPMILIYRVSQKEWHKVPENTKWFLSPKLCFIFSIVSIIIQSDSTKYLLTQSKMWNPDNFVLSSCYCSYCYCSYCMEGSIEVLSSESCGFYNDIDILCFKKKLPCQLVWRLQLSPVHSVVRYTMQEEIVIWLISFILIF